MSHEHNHECHCHDCGCSCSHSHEKAKNKKLELCFFIISLALFAVTFFVPNPIKLMLCIIATLLAGYKTFFSGVKSLLKLNFDETLLLTVAVVSAFLLKEGIEAAAVTILFNLGQKIEDYAVNSSQKSIDKLSQIQPKTANIILEDKNIKTIDVKEIKIGDKILIKAGERVPLDCEIINGSSSFDASAITGESMPADFKVGDKLLSGEINLTGAVECKVTSDLSTSTASQIIDLVKMSSQKKSETQKFVTRFAEIYTPVIMVLALLVALLPPLFNFGSFNTWIYRALVFLVASCPCAIVISIPLAFFSSIGRASKAGIFIKGSRDIEALANADTFVFDKTGTLTSGEFVVSNVSTANGLSNDELLTLAANAEQYSTHPIARAIVNYAGDFEKLDCKDINEISGKGIEVTVNDKKIICSNRTLMQDLGITVPETNDSVYVSCDGVFVGSITVEDALRSDSLAILKSLNIYKTVMLTGDNNETAEKIAKQCGIKNYCSNLLPQDKLNIVKQLQEQNRKVAFVGDGINDAPVISQSNVGIAVGKASDIVSNAADIVITGSSLNTLLKAVKLSHRTMKTVRFNFAFAIIIKAIVLILDVIGLSNMWFAVVADVGVTIIASLIATRLLYTKL